MPDHVNTCGSCGKMPAAGSSFCNHCGAKLPEVAAVVIEAPLPSAKPIDPRRILTSEVTIGGTSPVLIFGGGFIGLGVLLLLVAMIGKSAGTAIGWVAVVVGALAIGTRKMSWKPATAIIAGGAFCIWIAPIVGNTTTTTSSDQTTPEAAAPAKTAPTAPPVDQYKAAIALGGKKDFANAIVHLGQVPQGDPHYAQAQAKLAEYQQLEAQAKEAEAKAQVAEQIREARDSHLRLGQIEKNPDGHTGDLVAWHGTIMDISESGGSTFAQVSYTEGGEMTADNFFVKMDGSTEALKGDSVVVYGKFDHMQNYTS